VPTPSVRSKPATKQVHGDAETPLLAPQGSTPDTGEAESLYITLIEVENFKGIRLVRWTPDPTMAVVSGKNGAGKSSLLDGTMACLTSGARLPELPIKRGHKKATCYITLSRIVVDGSSPEAAYFIERTWTPSGGGIKITKPDGTPINEKPSEWLNRMFGAGGCDPLAFANAAPREQRDTLMRVTGLDRLMVSLDEEKAAALEERRRADAELKVAETALSALPDIPGPDEEVSVGDLLAKAAEAEKKNAENREDRAWLASRKERQSVVSVKIQSLREELAKAQAELEGIDSEIKQYEPAIAALQDVDAAAIRESIAGLEDLNTKARHRKQRRVTAERARDARERFSKANRRVEDVEASRRLAIEKAKMPVDGLAFKDDSVTFKDVPLAQVNTAMQLRIGVALALAEGKPIKTIFTRFGSLLDDDGMRALWDIASEHKAQVFVERVSGSGEGGLCIVEGEAFEGGEA